MLRNDCTTLLNVKIDTRHARFIPRGCVVFFPAPGVHCSPARDVMARTYLLRVQAVVGACKHSEICVVLQHAAWITFVTGRPPIRISMTRTLLTV